MRHSINFCKQQSQNAAVRPLLSLGLAVALIACFAGTATRAAEMQPGMDHGKKLMEQKQHGKMMPSTMENTTSVSKGDLTVSGPWARMSFGKAVNSAGFLTIANKGAKDDQLIAAAAPISRKVELHTHIKEGNVMKMRRIEGGIRIPAGGKAVLQPGGDHVMFIGLYKPLKMGDSFPLTLTFKNAGDIKLTVTAKKKAMPAGMKMMGHGKMMGHDKMNMGQKKMQTDGKK